MLDNLKLVLSRNRKILVIFFIVVFLPSIILAIFGIRAIQNERFKLQQQTLEDQKAYVRTIQTDIRSFIEKNVLGLTELSLNRAFSETNYPEITRIILERLKGESLFGEVVIWDKDGTPWFPVCQSHPPSERVLVVPEEWNRWRLDLNKAEIAEFRRKNFPDAISLYRRIQNQAKNDQVKAWILNRIARCQVKLKRNDQAQATYRSIVGNFSDLSTESGRSLEFSSRLEILSILRLEDNFQVLLKEFLETYGKLEKRAWSLDESQLMLYKNSLEEILNEEIAVNPSRNVPEDFMDTVRKTRKSTEKILKIWDLAEFSRQSTLPAVRDRLEASENVSPLIDKRAFEYENEEYLLLLSPLAGIGSNHSMEFLGSFIKASVLTENAEILSMENQPKGLSVLIRSNISDKIVFGEEVTEERRFVFTDFFLENFPPWRVEIYQVEGAGSGFLLYKNIFFWMILFMLLILFFGSGLIIRLLMQEVNLLHLKSEFIASVSHEFKTPLTSMGAILERLLDEEIKNPDKAREYYRILRHDSDRLKRLVANVLDFTKIEEGKRKYRMEQLDVGHLVQKEVDSFKKEYRLSGFRVELDMKNGSFPVSADEEALGQALHNILDNAAKFSQREKRIEVSVKRNGDKIEITVSDNGIGITETEQKKIFEKFYRGKQATSVSPTGTGLGLTLVKHIMAAHGGEIIVQSRPGEGSRISLILPVREEMSK